MGVNKGNAMGMGKEGVEGWVKGCGGVKKGVKDDGCG